MSPIEASLSDGQKERLEWARRRLGLRSRAEVIRWFADHVVEIVDALEDQLSSLGIIEQGKPPTSKP